MKIGFSCFVFPPLDLLPDCVPLPRGHVRRLLHELVVRHEPQRPLGIPGEARHPQGGQREIELQSGPSLIRDVSFCFLSEVPVPYWAAQ